MKKRKANVGPASGILANKWFLGMIVLIVAVGVISFLSLRGSEDLASTQGDEVAGDAGDNTSSPSIAGVESEDSQIIGLFPISSGGSSGSSGSSSSGASSPETITIAINDTDGIEFNGWYYTGIIHKKGTCSDEFGSYIDSCEDDKLIEWSLHEGVCYNNTVDCNTYGDECSAGACTGAYEDFTDEEDGGMCFDSVSLMKGSTCNDYEYVRLPKNFGGICIYESLKCSDLTGEAYCTEGKNWAYCNETTNLEVPEEPEEPLFEYWDCQEACDGEGLELFKAWMEPIAPAHCSTWANGEGATASILYAYGGDVYVNGGCCCATADEFDAIDSDGGTEEYEKGTCEDAIDVYEDFCWEEDEIFEYYIYAGTDCEGKIVSCLSCVDGACVGIDSDGDSDRTGWATTVGTCEDDSGVTADSCACKGEEGCGVLTEQVIGGDGRCHDYSFDCTILGSSYECSLGKCVVPSSRS